MTTPLRTSALAALLVFSIAASASASEMRVTLLGDSLAFGAGDESGKGLAGRLAPELRSRGIESVVTSNFGVTGATTADLSGALRKPEVRTAVSRADAIVVSVGANDLRATLLGERPARSPLVVAEQVLRNIDAIVSDVRQLNPQARILILGGYAPIAHESAAAVLEPLIAVWDAALLAQFIDDPLVSIVQMSDIVDRPERLSPVDSFHPAAEAYQETARRIAGMLTESGR